MQKIDLFPTSIWKGKISPTAYDKATLVKTVEENYRRDPHRSAWQNDGTLHHCYSDWDNPKFIKYDVDQLMQVYSQVIWNFMSSLPLLNAPTYNYILVNITANKEGQYMGVHDHMAEDATAACAYSCVHYIKLKDNQPSTTFINPLIVGQFTGALEFIKQHTNAVNPLNSAYHHTWNVPTQEDDFIIFPSYLKHKVQGDWKQQSPDELRITSAVNINFLKK